MRDKKGKRQRKKQWSKKEEDAEIAFWNPWSYSNERHQYRKSLGTDILGLGELHGVQFKDQFQRFT